MEKLKFPWGELIIVGTTKELSVGMDIITPGSTPDEPGTYLKKGDLIKIKAGIKKCF